MKKPLALWLTLAVVAAALAASAILLVDYIRPAPVFCDAAGACAKVRGTVFARPLGVPLPAIGLSGMLGIALAALVPGRGARLVQLGLSVIAALAALVLLGVQAQMKMLCPFCAVVDGAAIVLAALAVLRFVEGWDPPPGRRHSALAVSGLLLAIGVPLVVGFQRRALPTDLPWVIAEEIGRTGPGKVTVVDFADFECPYCRHTHAVLAPLLEAHKEKVRVVRKHVPLSIHPHALDAAKAGCCAETLGKGEAMAEALFTAPLKEMTADGCEEMARRVGLDVESFRACVKDPATLARIEKDREAFRSVKSIGLPTLFVDGTRLAGDQDRATLASTLDAALRAL